MIILKLLGFLDLISAFTLLMLVFGIHPYFQLVLFCSLLLLLKGMFIFTGNVSSLQDIYVSILLILSLFLTPFSLLLWIGAFLLLAKGTASMF